MRVNAMKKCVAGAMISILANPLLFTWLDRWTARQAAPADTADPDPAPR